MGIDGPEAVGSKFNMPDINVDTDYFLNVSFFIFILLHHCLTLPKAVIRRCFTKMVFLKIYRKTSVSESLSNKVANIVISQRNKHCKSLGEIYNARQGQFRK